MLNQIQVLLASPGSLSNSTTYVINIKFWRVPLTSDCDTTLMICDIDDCYGFMLYEQGGGATSHTKSSSSTCPKHQPEFSWDVQQVWDFRFELSRSNTITTLWSGTANEGQSVRYDAMSPEGGLWLTVCRNEIDESQEIRFIEVSIKTT